MPEILALLQTIAPLLAKTTFRQLGHVIFGLLTAQGRLTMLGLARWTEPGGSYRTLQRFYHTEVPWAALHWAFFQGHLHQPEAEYILAGDEVVVSKAGHETHGLERFFSSLQQRVIPGVAFFAFSAVNVAAGQAYPLQVTQVVKTAEEKAARQAQAMAPATAPKRKPGRPKGSKNKGKATLILNPELQRIQTALKRLLETVGSTLALKYVVLDGHFGNYPSAFMVREVNLHLVSKLRHNAALFLPFAGPKPTTGRCPKYGPQLNVCHLDVKYWKATTTEAEVRTDLYQGQFLNKEFAFPLNVVILRKTNLRTHVQAHVLLFSTDLALPYAKLIQFYRLRFQIEFNFRDAKQVWGLEDFMHVKETAVTNAANLALFMVNFSHVLLPPFRAQQPDFSILDLKAHYRGCRYVSETIKMLPQKPDAILLAAILQRIAQLGAIHPPPRLAPSP